MSSQDEEMSKLKRKLETFNAIITERDELREICEQIEFWKERFENGYKKVFTEQKTTCNIQLEKLKKVMAKEYVLDLKLRELQNINDCNCNQIKTLRLNEKKIQSELTDYKLIIKKLMEELNSVKSELDKKNCAVEQLNVNLKSHKDELCDVRRQLEYHTKECNRLNEINEKLDTELKYIKIKLADTARTEENLTLERESLSNELKTKCKILSEIELQYDKAKCEINGEKTKIKQLIDKLVKVYKEKQYDQIGFKNEIEMLKNDNDSKEVDIRNLKKKIDKLKQENERNVIEINAKKRQLEEKECQFNLNQMTFLADRIEVENHTPISCTDLNVNSLIEKYTPNTNMTNTINRKAELNNLNCELENLKKDLGIDSKKQTF